MSFCEAQEAMHAKRKGIKRNALIKTDATLLPKTRYTTAYPRLSYLSSLVREQAH
jgi:hypothetical protein